MKNTRSIVTAILLCCQLGTSFAQVSITDPTDSIFRLYSPLTLIPINTEHFYYDYPDYCSPLCSYGDTLCCWIGIESYDALPLSEDNGWKLTGSQDEQIAEIARYWYTDSTLTIMGISAELWDSSIWDILRRAYESGEIQQRYGYYDILSMRIAARLYKPVGNNILNLVKEVSCHFGNPSDTITRILYSDSTLCINDPTISSCNSIPRYNLFFDTPVSISDSFYISMVVYKNASSDSNDFLTYALPAFSGEVHMKRGQSHITQDLYYKKPFDSPDYHYQPVKMLARRASAPPDLWDLELWNHRRFFLYPIIRLPGDTCASVHDVQIYRASESSVLVRWPVDDENLGYEISYGTAGTPPEEGTVVENTSGLQMLTGLDPDCQYVAYIRSRCHHFADVYSDWGEGHAFTVEGLGTGSPTAARPASVWPNPARASLSIEAAEPLETVSVYDAAGRRFYSTCPHAQHLRLDTSRWPRGTYIVTLSTPSATEARQVVIE